VIQQKAVSRFGPSVMSALDSSAARLPWRMFRSISREARGFASPAFAGLPLSEIGDIYEAR
jgi:hypothetical protein